MEPLDHNTLNDLTLTELIRRMDEILRQNQLERYGKIYEAFPVGLVSDIVNSQKVTSLADVKKRKIAYITFDYLVQLELHAISSGFSNMLLYNNQYDEKLSWQSPSFRLREGAIRQYQIISSRIAMEIFMDLLHCIETGERLDSKRSKRSKYSKLKIFREWLCNPQNQFHYFAHVLLYAYQFDREFRTPEIHGTPKLPSRLLTLQCPTHHEMNTPFKLLNVLINCWNPLLEILNEQRPTYMNISKDEEDWFSIYMTGSEKIVAEKLRSMFDDIK